MGTSRLRVADSVRNLTDGLIMRIGQIFGLSRWLSEMGKPREGRGVEESRILFYFGHVRFAMSQIPKERCYLGSWI